MITQDNATMIYAGIKTSYNLGNFFTSPVSLQDTMIKEEDLGHNLEFKSQINLGGILEINLNLVYLIVIYQTQVWVISILVLIM